jgi:hypothetical protein
MEAIRTPASHPSLVVTEGATKRSLVVTGKGAYLRLLAWGVQRCDDSLGTGCGVMDNMVAQPSGVGRILAVRRAVISRRLVRRSRLKPGCILVALVGSLSYYMFLVSL